MNDYKPLHSIENQLERELVSGLLKLSALIIFASVLQHIAYAQDESAPQTRLSSKGLAYVNLSTSPANPVTGQPTIILLQFLDPQTKAPRGDIYYRFIIRNETDQIFVVPGGSTIAGKVGIPYQFNNPGKYQVEVDLNDTVISTTPTTSIPLDEVTFPIYVEQGAPQEQNQTVLNATDQVNSEINTNTPTMDNSHLLVDGVLVAIIIGLVLFVVKRRKISKQKKSGQ